MASFIADGHGAAGRRRLAADAPVDVLDGGPAAEVPRRALDCASKSGASSGAAAAQEAHEHGGELLRVSRHALRFCAAASSAISALAAYAVRSASSSGAVRASAGVTAGGRGVRARAHRAE
jgi:hypothetical protein